MSKSWDGTASDTHIFQERAHALMATFQGSPTPRSLVADAKLYTAEHAANLKQLGFITRIPGTLKLVSQVIRQALTWDTWSCLDETTRYQSIAREPGHHRGDGDGLESRQPSLDPSHLETTPGATGRLPLRGPPGFSSGWSAAVESAPAPNRAR
jgi:hypothetical protein